MKKVNKVTSCKDCPFFEIDGGMEKTLYCGHPYWVDNNYGIEGAALSKEEYEKDSPPDRCPLRKNKLTIQYKLG